MVRRLHKEITFFLILALIGSSRLYAAEIHFVPSIGVSEDVTDNVYETVSGRRAEVVTRVQPGGALKYASSSSTLEAIYNLDYRYHALKNYNDGISHTLGVNGTFTLIDDFLKLDLSDTFSRISLDVARDTTAESLSVDQVDQNTLSISPYLLWRFGKKGIIKTGLRYADIRYWNPNSIDKRQEGTYIQLTHELTGKLSINAGYAFTKTITKPLLYDDHDLSVGFRYEFAAQSFFFGSIGNSWLFSDRNRISNLFWDTGIIRDFGTMVATLETQVRYTEDPLTVSLRQVSHSLKLDKIMPRTTLGLTAAYNEYQDALTGASSRHGTTIGTGASREVSPNLTASLNVAGDQLNRRSSLDYPYHLSAIGSLGYQLGHESSIGFTYTYASYRYHLDQRNGSIEINRAILQYRKTF